MWRQQARHGQQQHGQQAQHARATPVLFNTTTGPWEWRFGGTYTGQLLAHNRGVAAACYMKASRISVVLRSTRGCERCC